MNHLARVPTSLLCGLASGALLQRFPRSGNNNNNNNSVFSSSSVESPVACRWWSCLVLFLIRLLGRHGTALAMDRAVSTLHMLMENKE